MDQFEVAIIDAKESPTLVSVLCTKIELYPMSKETTIYLICRTSV